MKYSDLGEESDFLKRFCSLVGGVQGRAAVLLESRGTQEL